MWLRFSVFTCEMSLLGIFYSNLWAKVPSKMRVENLRDVKRFRLQCRNVHCSYKSVKSERHWNGKPPRKSVLKEESWCFLSLYALSPTTAGLQSLFSMTPLLRLLQACCDLWRWHPLPEVDCYLNFSFPESLSRSRRCQGFHRTPYCAQCLASCLEQSGI